MPTKPKSCCSLSDTHNPFNRPPPPKVFGRRIHTRAWKREKEKGGEREREREREREAHTTNNTHKGRK